MKINVPHVAKLANLPLKDEDIKKFESQLTSILDFVKKLQGVDTTNVKPTSQVTGLENVTREDKTSPSLSQEEALSNTKSTHNGMFKSLFEKSSVTLCRHSGKRSGEAWKSIQNLQP